MLNLIIEAGIIGIALYGLIASIILVFTKNAKVEKKIYDITGIVSAIAFLLFAIYFFMII